MSLPLLEWRQTCQYSVRTTAHHSPHYHRPVWNAHFLYMCGHTRAYISRPSVVGFYLIENFPIRSPSGPLAELDKSGDSASSKCHMRKSYKADLKRKHVASAHNRRTLRGKQRERAASPEYILYIAHALPSPSRIVHFLFRRIPRTTTHTGARSPTTRMRSRAHTH